MRFLVVDDIFANRLLICEILNGFGHEITEAENGRVALDLIEQHDYDAILMDIEMPVMNGIETTDHIRNKLHHPKNKTKVIALTAHNPALFFEDYSDVGFDDLLTKPYSIDKLKGLVKEIEDGLKK
jgi:two-component system, response regulator, stage 0 sporulation protein F